MTPNAVLQTPTAVAAPAPEGTRGKPLYRVGDTIVCVFHFDEKRKNYSSYGPDEVLAAVDKGHATKLVPKAPYVCTIKHVAESKNKPGSFYYIVIPNRVCHKDDYDQVLEADFNRAKMRLGLRYPTKYESAKAIETDADVEEEVIPATSGAPKKLRVTLRVGHTTKVEHFTRGQALKMGYRINHFVPVQLPKGGATNPHIHRGSALPQASWHPSVLDHTGYLLRSTTELLPAIALAQKEFGAKRFTEMASKRLAQIATLRAYDAIPPDSLKETTLEHALTAAARLAYLTYAVPNYKWSLIQAEKKLMAKHLEHQEHTVLLAILNMTGHLYKYDPATQSLTTSLASFLEATQGYNDGPWRLNNIPITAGMVRLTLPQGRVLAVEHAAMKLSAETPQPSADLKALLDELHAAMTSIHGELEGNMDVADRDVRLRLNSVPPCVGFVLRKAMQGTLTEAESYLAYTFLTRIGIRQDAIHRSLYGTKAPEPRRYRSPGNSANTQTKSFRPPPCSTNKRLGICAWSCAGIQSPLQFYVQHAAADADAEELDA